MTVTDADIRLYSVPQLATLWGCSRRFVYLEIQAGRIPTVDISNGESRSKMRVRAADALAWIERRTA
ncbi:MAG TPA: helix-turn-helix domain-containing protein [Jatrophihabitans sp.]|nr:helix-turn-helix domain-containing protein [Jatrophihabitans sp.]